MNATCLHLLRFLPLAGSRRDGGDLLDRVGIVNSSDVAHKRQKFCPLPLAEW